MKKPPVKPTANAPRGPGSAAAPAPNPLAALAPAPKVHFPPMVLPAGNGVYMVKPGKPIVLNDADEIGSAEAASIIGRSQRRIQGMCDEGILREGTDWRRVGNRGNYIIRRSAALRIRGFIVEKENGR